MKRNIKQFQIKIKPNPNGWQIRSCDLLRRIFSVVVLVDSFDPFLFSEPKLRQRRMARRNTVRTKTRISVMKKKSKNLFSDFEQLWLEFLRKYDSKVDSLRISFTETKQFNFFLRTKIMHFECRKCSIFKEIKVKDPFL